MHRGSTAPLETQVAPTRIAVHGAAHGCCTRGRASAGRWMHQWRSPHPPLRASQPDPKIRSTSRVQTRCLQASPSATSRRQKAA